FVALADVEMAGAERDDVIDQGLDALGNERLQHMAFDRQPEARHGGEPRAVAGNDDADLPGADDAAGGFHADRATVLHHDPGYFAILHDVDAAVGRRARIAPDHRVVARGAAARLHQSAVYWKARVVVVEIGQERTHALSVEEFAAGAVQPHRIAAPREG